MKRLRTPAVSTIDWAAARALGYRPACTLLMQTARGTLTTLLPMAAPAPDTKAIPPASTPSASFTASINLCLTPKLLLVIMPASTATSLLQACQADNGASSRGPIGVALCIQRWLKSSHTFIEIAMPPESPLCGGVECKVGPDDDACPCGCPHNAPVQATQLCQPAVECCCHGAGACLRQRQLQGLSCCRSLRHPPSIAA